MRHQPRRGRKSTHSRKKLELARRGMDEAELAKLQAFEDLNRGFKSVMKMIVPALVTLVFLVCFYFWLKSL